MKTNSKPKLKQKTDSIQVNDSRNLELKSLLRYFNVNQSHFVEFEKYLPQFLIPHLELCDKLIDQEQLNVSLIKLSPVLYGMKMISEDLPLNPKIMEQVYQKFILQVVGDNNNDMLVFYLKSKSLLRGRLKKIKTDLKDSLDDSYQKSNPQTDINELRLRREFDLIKDELSRLNKRITKITEQLVEQ